MPPETGEQAKPVIVDEKKAHAVSDVQERFDEQRLGQPRHW